MKVYSLNKKENALTKLAHDRVRSFDYCNSEDITDLVSELLGELLDKREIHYRLDCIFEGLYHKVCLKPEDIIIKAGVNSLSVELYLNKVGLQGIMFHTERYTDRVAIPSVSFNSWGKTGLTDAVVQRGDDGLATCYVDENINVSVVCYDMFKPICERGKGYDFDTANGRAVIEVKANVGTLTYALSENRIIDMIKEVYPQGSKLYYLNIFKELNETLIEFKLDSGRTVYGLMKSVIV